VGVFEIWLLTGDGSNARSITRQGHCVQPFWSPDGKQIAVSARLDEQHHRIYVMDTNGSALHAIRQPEGEDNMHPAWSPDGRAIVFTSGRGSKGALYACDVAHSPGEH